MTARIRMATLALTAAGLLIAPIQARRPDHTQLVVFGDSLSDTGNAFILSTLFGAQPALPPSEEPNRAYFDGRFSNGPIAFEYFWNRMQPGPLLPIAPSLSTLGVPPRGAVSFAFGASGSGIFTEVQGVPVPGFLTQVELLRQSVAGGPAPGDALYAVFTGANDYIVQPGELPANPVTVVNNIAIGISRLYAVGARDMIVLNLPDLGQTPLVGPGSPAALALSQLVSTHNTLLAARLATLPALLPGLRIVPVDVHGLVAGLPPGVNFETPALDVLVPSPPSGIPASRCIFVAPAACPNVPRFHVSHTLFFWDAQHPTTAMHARLGRHVHEMVKDVLR